jgi:hypothetical protein
MHDRSNLRARGPAWLAACALILAVIGTGSASAAQSAATSAPQITPAAQALVNRVIQALGGQAFLKAKTLTTTGRAFSIFDGVAQGFVTFHSAAVFPDKRRLSYGLNNSKGITLINNGDKGWEIDRYGLIDQTDRELHGWILATRYDLGNLLRFGIHNPGTLVIKGEQDFVENVPVQILEIIDSRQVDAKVDIDTQNYLPVRVAYKIQNPESHDWDDYVDIYADYQAIQGIETPMHLVRNINGQRVAETFRSSAKYNEDYPAPFFTPTGQ